MKTEMTLSALSIFVLKKDTHSIICVISEERDNTIKQNLAVEEREVSGTLLIFIKIIKKRGKAHGRCERFHYRELPL